MLEQMILRERFEDLLARQQNALGCYESAGSNTTDPETRKQLNQLCKEKKRHIQLTERLLEIVE